MGGGALAMACALAVAACNEATTQPEVELQKIEEVEFAAELGIDLAEYSQLQNGVYYRDAVVGDGTPITYGTRPTITLTGWLADGTVFAEGTTDFTMGLFRLPVGFEEGMLNARVGGTRWLLVPPAKGLGAIDQFHALGTRVVPAGSVLVYEVVVDGVG